jgi:CBS domain containing-hemolysin-like protein
MNNLIIGVLSLALACIGIVLKKTYYYLPVNELKRRAEKSDPVAVKLYTPMSYGSSLKVLLWLYIGLTSAVSFILFAREMPIWLSLLIIGPLIYVVFSLLPSSRVTKFGITLTKLATPILNWLLNYLHPLLSRGSEKVEKKYIISNHTGLYERTDLIDLINRQQKQADNRLSEKELDTLKRALIFNDKKVSDILTSWDKVKTILSKDTIGPILINELHKSGQQFILVKDTPKGSVVGILAFTDLNLKSHGKVENNMNDSARLFYH